MKKEMKKVLNVIIYLIVILFGALFIYNGNHYMSDTTSGQRLLYDRENELNTLISARVISIDSDLINTEYPNNTRREITFTAKNFGDSHNTDILIHGSQILNDNNKNIAPISRGDKIICLSYGDEYIFQYYYRFDKILILGFIVAAVILLLGGLKGFNTIVSLTLTCLSVFLVYIPSIKAGYNIYLSTAGICIFIITVTLIIIYGLSKKSIITAVSCSAGVLFSGIISLFADKWMKLTGYINDDTYMLDLLMGFDINVKAVIFSMITIGALGAIMDVSMSVTSPLCEMKEANRNIGTLELLKSGLSIGRDFMGTMTNTLILAYMGSSLIVVLVYAASNYPLMSLFNKEEIIMQFLQSLIGCLGILFTIPFTTVIASVILGQKQEKMS